MDSVEPRKAWISSFVQAEHHSVDRRRSIFSLEEVAPQVANMMKDIGEEGVGPKRVEGVT
jgi:hypothetical protein